MKISCKPWYKFWTIHFSNPRTPMIRSRATWSQMLLSYGIKDTKSLTRRLVDADSIPASLDVPIQHIKLWELGIIAFTLGFTTVNIDFGQRKFHALGPMASLTTTEVPSFGSVIRFDGDIFGLHETITRSSATWLSSLSLFANGIIQFGKYRTNGAWLPLDILTDAIKYEWKGDEYREKVRDRVWNLDEEDVKGGNLRGEASCFRDQMDSEILRHLDYLEASSLAMQDVCLFVLWVGGC
jgi:hypothetical protein